MLKRHEIQGLRRAGHTLEEVVNLAGVSQSSVQREELTLREAAEMLGVAHPRIADLLAKRAERFSLDRLALLAEQLGLNVRIRATRPYGTEAQSD